MRNEWSTEDLVATWTLVGEDWQLVGNKTGPTRLGFALLLKFFEIEGRFPRSADELPPAGVVYGLSVRLVAGSTNGGVPAG